MNDVTEKHNILSKYLGTNCSSEDVLRLIRVFNRIISGLYDISAMGTVLYELNSTSSVEEETKRILGNNFENEMIELAYKLELVRSLLFGEVLDWEKIGDPEGLKPTEDAFNRRGTV